MFKNLRELATVMQDESACREYLAKQRWPDGNAICPHCGYDKCYSIEKRTKYKCGNRECYKKFSVKVGTIFEASNISLSKWFIGVYLSCSHKKGVSSYQLGKDIGVSQKCAWFMLHRIREMMRPKENIKLDNIVEVDEVFIGGKLKNMNRRKRRELHETGRVSQTKTMVMGLIERGGELKLIPGGNENDVTLIQPIVKANVDKEAVIMTDSSGNYVGIKNDYAGHETVNHTINEYVRDGVIHTNTIEGAFSHFKRSIYGVYHQLTAKHLSRYCDETAFRYNLRKIKDADRFTLALQKTKGRLSYKNLIASPEPKIVLSVTTPQVFVENIPKKNGHPVVQIKDGQIIARYASIKEAAIINKVNAANIRRVLLGEQRTAGGYQWKYA